MPSYRRPVDSLMMKLGEAANRLSRLGVAALFVEASTTIQDDSH